MRTARSFMASGTVILSSLANGAHEAIACSGISASAAAPPRAGGLTSRATLAHEAIACSGFSLLPPPSPVATTCHVSAFTVTQLSCHVIYGGPLYEYVPVCLPCPCI
jgi:hypothetical protein